MQDLPIQIVDAHQHFWNVETNYHPWLRDQPSIPFRYGDYSALRKNYLPPDYFQDAANHQVVKTVYVETEWDATDPIGETRWVEKVHAQHGVPNAVVAQAWLDRDDVDEVLATQAQSSLVRSVRHKPKAAPSADAMKPGMPGSMSDPHWRAGYALLQTYGLSFDLQTPYWHLAEAAELAAEFPATTLILNHTGLPADRSTKGISSWQESMKTLAQVPNVVVKISGLGLPNQPWRLEDNQAIILDTIAMFGVERCMFASNFPVDKLCADFDTLFSGFKIVVQGFTHTEQKQLFHDNAVRIYRI